MTICTPPMPRSVTYSQLANEASCDAHTFFGNNIGFCSFGQDPQIQQPLQLINNCCKTILAGKKKTKITIVSNIIEKKTTNTNFKKKIYYHCMSNMMHLSVCLIRCRCCHLLLMHMWFNKCVILLKRQNSRRIPWLCRTDEWV